MVLRWRLLQIAAAALTLSAAVVSTYRKGVSHGKAARRKAKPSQTPSACRPEQHNDARRRKNELKAADRANAVERASQEAAARKSIREAAPEGVPARVLRAEAVLGYRTERVVLVLEGCVDCRNQAAVIRTAEALGVQVP